MRKLRYRGIVPTANESQNLSQSSLTLEPKLTTVIIISVLILLKHWIF